MQQTAQRIAGILHAAIREEEGEQPAFPLVQFFKAHRYGELGGELQQAVRESAVVDVVAHRPEELRGDDEPVPRQFAKRLAHEPLCLALSDWSWVHFHPQQSPSVF